MARPKIKEPKKQYTVMLKPSTVKEFDKLAKKLELSRSQLMSNLMLMGFDDAKALDKAGALWIVKAGKKAYEFFKNQLNGEKKEANQ